MWVRVSACVCVIAFAYVCVGVWVRKHANRSALEQICGTLLKIDVPQLVTVSLIVLVSSIRVCQHKQTECMICVWVCACDMCAWLLLLATDISVIRVEISAPTFEPHASTHYTWYTKFFFFFWLATVVCACACVCITIVTCARLCISYGLWTFSLFNVISNVEWRINECLWDLTVLTAA